MLTPQTEAELSDAIAQAKGSLAILGGGTRTIGQTPTGTPITTSSISGINDYEPGALTLVVKAGTPLAEIETALAAEGQMLAFEPMDYRPVLGTDGEPTIGGVVAANVSGPRRIQAGACRDFLLGVRFVDGNGKIIKNGGRVMKNVTGYDLTKLMAGSRGTLGILTEVSFKVLPKPESTAVLLLHGLSVDKAVNALADALQSPFEVTGAAHVPAGLDGSPVTMIRLEGFEDSVAYRSEQLKARLAGFGPLEIETRQGDNTSHGTEPGWKWVRNAEMFAGGTEDVWRLSVKPSDAPKVAVALPEAKLLLDCGGGLIWAGVAPGTDVRTAIAHVAGHATIIRSSRETKDTLGVFHPEPDTLKTLAKALRHQFDPRGILNPGLMG